MKKRIELLTKKRLIFIITIILLIIVTGLYSSYAINVYYNEGIPLTYDQALDFSLSNELEQEVLVEANKTKVIDFDITNPYEGNIKYGLTYKMINPTTLPDGVIIAQSSESLAFSVGMLEEDDSIIVSIIIVNNTDSNLTLSLGLVYGYENGGELILEDNKILINKIYGITDNIMADIPEQSPALLTLKKLNLLSSLKYDIPDFTKTSCSSECAEATVGIYPYEDDLGTSYYFRGDVENNYVKFGKWSEDTPDVYYGYDYDEEIFRDFSTLKECQEYGDSVYEGLVYGYPDFSCTLISRAGKDMYWRIIRINGDGTVRMIYDGTQAWENGSSNVDRNIGKSVFNSNSGDNAYVGYMYGQTGVTETGTTGYNLTHSNDNNSTIKTYLEGELTSNNTGWYYNNIIATGYHEYVADAIYCNDRSLGSEGTGIGETETYYGAYERLYRNYTTDVDPRLICTNSNDRFTISNSTLAPTDGQGTNQKLKYPVGLITADEIVLAGDGHSGKTKYYLKNDTPYWTMTPNDWDFNGLVFLVNYDGKLAAGIINSIYADGFVKPVISLHSDALKYGTGVIGDEFRVEN